MYIRAATLTCVLGIAACGTSLDYTPLNTAPRPTGPRSPESVQVFTTAIPDRPYVEVGMIESRQESGWSTDGASEIMKKMREYAGQQGCDGLVVNGSNDAVVGSAKGIATLKGYKATCIVFKDAN